MRIKLAAILALTLLLAATPACTVARPTVKLGLVAPFEGRYRDLGYEVIFAVRLAVREINASGGLHGYDLELVALDDSGDPAMAVEQAEKLTTDPQILAVIGHWLDDTTTAALPVYTAAELPIIVTAAQPDPLPADSVRLFPSQSLLDTAIDAAALALSGQPCRDCDLLTGADLASQSPPDLWRVGPPIWGLQQFDTLTDSRGYLAFVSPAAYPDPQSAFYTRYAEIAPVGQAGVYAALAYDATWVFAAALDAALTAQPNRRPTPADLAAALPAVSLTGQTGDIAFTTTGEWQNPPILPYGWRDGQRYAFPP